MNQVASIMERAGDGTGRAAPSGPAELMASYDRFAAPEELHDSSVRAGAASGPTSIICSTGPTIGWGC